MNNEVCDKEGVEPLNSIPGSKLGIVLSTLGQMPINGLRHAPEKGTNGWYIWCGEILSEANDFFDSLHVEHIDEYLPAVSKYLDLSPGYRFQIDGNGYEDIWYDSNIFAS